VIGVAQDRLAAERPEKAADIRAAGRPFLQFSPELEKADRDIKAFLYASVYRHPEVMRVREQAAAIVRDLFHVYFAEPRLMGGHFWADEAEGLPAADRARHVADYIAGMTDTYALEAHRRLFDHTPDLR
jgi:dGTPase